jgi:hypothetical protein
VDFVGTVTGKDDLGANDVLRCETFGLCVMRGIVPGRRGAGCVLLIHW